MEKAKYKAWLIKQENEQVYLDCRSPDWYGERKEAAFDLHVANAIVCEQLGVTHEMFFMTKFCSYPGGKNGLPIPPCDETWTPEHILTGHAKYMVHLLSVFCCPLRHPAQFLLLCKVLGVDPWWFFEHY